MFKKICLLISGILIGGAALSSPIYASGERNKQKIDTNKVYYVETRQDVEVDANKSTDIADLGYLIMLPTQPGTEGNAIYVSSFDNDEYGGTEPDDIEKASKQAKKETEKIIKSPKLQQFILDKLNQMNNDQDYDEESLYKDLKKKGLERVISLRHYVITGDNNTLDLYYPYKLGNSSPVNLYDIVQGKTNKNGVIKFRDKDNTDQSKPTSETEAEEIIKQNDPNNGNRTGKPEVDSLMDQAESDEDVLSRYESSLEQGSIKLVPTSMKIK